MERAPELAEDFTRNNPELKEVRIFHPVSGRIIVSNEREDVGKKIYKKTGIGFIRQEVSPFVIKKRMRYLPPGSYPQRTGLNAISVILQRKDTGSS